jgi:nitric oxide reductase NorE protein
LIASTMSFLSHDRNEGRKRTIPGEEGTWVFLFGDMTIFAVLFAAYLYHRGVEPSAFAESQAKLHQIFAIVNTLLLLTSSLLVVTAARSVRRGGSQLATRLTVGAFVLGLAFVVNKAIEYALETSAGLTPNTNSFFMYFYIVTGLHLFHVVIGLMLLGCMIFLTSRRCLSGRQQAYLDGIACYWHMVDLLWIVIVPLLYLVH